MSLSADQRSLLNQALGLDNGKTVFTGHPLRKWAGVAFPRRFAPRQDFVIEGRGKWNLIRHRHWGGSRHGTEPRLP
jgi:hypothetical protein